MMGVHPGGCVTQRELRGQDEDRLVDPTRRTGELDYLFGPTHPFGELDDLFDPTRPLGELNGSNSLNGRIGTLVRSRR